MKGERRMGGEEGVRIGKRWVEGRELPSSHKRGVNGPCSPLHTWTEPMLPSCSLQSKLGGREGAGLG